jgi:hypothetical protein
VSGWPLADSADHADGYDAPPPPMAELLDLLRGYLHLEDAGHVWFALATAVTASFGGDPLWGMLVGASSGGKTEIIRALDGIAVHVDELTGASLLSWHTRKGQWRPVGVLRRVEGRALLTVGDFSTVLAMSDRGARDQLFANLRRVYDGHLFRDIGNAPQPLEWSGRLTLLAGCTSAIDNYSAHADQLGPRWLYYRLASKPTRHKRATSRKARGVGATVDEYRAKVRDLAVNIVADAQQHARSVTLGEDAGERVDDMAIVACYCRAAVPRNGYGRREIDGLAEVEEPPRLTNQLMLLARGLLALGLAEGDALALCRRAALDSMPEVRQRALTHLAAEKVLTVSEVARRIGCHRDVARRTLEDLAAIGLVDGDDPDETVGQFQPHHWWLAGDDAELVREVLSLPRSVGTHPPLPPDNMDKRYD